MESLLGLDWNHCSVWIGIAARFGLESLPGLDWNHCSVWIGIAARFGLEYASDKKITIDTFTQNRRAMFRFSIDTEKNDLFIDLDGAVCKLKNDKDKINAEIDLNELILMRDYLLSGQIRIYSPDGNLLASSTPYRPSFDLGRSISDLNKIIETAKLELERFN